MPGSSAPDEPGPTAAEEPDALWRAALDALPTQLAITTGAGEPVRSNAAWTRHQRAPDAATRLLETLSTPFRHHDADYVVEMSTDITEQRRLEDRLFQRAYFDDLTGLPNRALIEKTVGDLLESNGGEPFALAFLDVDEFKQINDFYGHGAGDELLIKIAERISKQLRPSDLVARVGGDEFLLLVSPVDKPEDVAAFFERLLRQLNNPFFIDGQEVFSSTSIGVSLYPEHGTSYQMLRANADSAMYRLKSSCKGGIRLFEQAIGQAVSQRAALEQRLRLAIRDRRLCCVYQPKVDFRQLEVKGVEVLLRWRDEQGLIQPPGSFLSLATELGLMDEITHIVLDETVAAIDLINAAFGPETSISVNIAARQAADVRFMTSVAAALSASGFPRRFMVELTEEAFLAKSVFQTRVMPLLKEHGIRVSIDDFGVGYSSLSALADLTADEIKVDRSFITDIHRRPRSQVILKAIESLGHALGMEVLVEGVETLDELTYLQAATRIRFAQGFYFARPMLLEELPKAGGDGARALQPARLRAPNRQPGPRRRLLR